MTSNSLQSLFEAMHHGKYEFDDFLNAQVSKDYDVVKLNGRLICRPNKKLKAYQQFLNAFICEYLDINPRVVFSYRKGINPHAAISAHAAGRAFFQADISNFFGSIDSDLIRRTLETRSSRVPVNDLPQYHKRILELTTAADGFLAVGFVTSPPISNACLTGFDDALEALCLKAGLTYTRYSDDLVISAPSREALQAIQSQVDSLLKSHSSAKLKLNPDKNKFTSVGRKIKILGMVILPSGRVTIDMELKRRIEYLLHFYATNREKFLNAVDSDLKTGIEQLSGYINYANAADALYLDKLRKKFGSTVIDSFLHKSAT
jgi:RNA-directed DNA polymerase